MSISKQEKGTYLLKGLITTDHDNTGIFILSFIFLSIEIFSGPNKVCLLHSRPASLLYLHSFEQGTFGVPPANFFQLLLSIGFLCNKLLLLLSFKYPRVRLTLLCLRAKIFVVWKFCGFPVGIQKQRNKWNRNYKIF